jgi:enoyl-CoA hydratase
MSDVLRVDRHGAVRVVSLNRPEVANAVDLELQQALVDVWAELAADEEARAVVLTGAGEAFCAGGDLGWIATFEHDHAARDHSLVLAEALIEALLSFPRPVVAAVNGPAVGLGCSMALLCDVVLMADDATLADPHVALGLVAGDGGAAFWPLLAPLLRTRRYLLTGEPIEAAAAVEVGLATAVVPADELAAEALGLAERLARRPRLAVESTKALLNRHLRRAVEDGTLAAGFAAERRSMEDPEHLARLAELVRRAEG